MAGTSLQWHKPQAQINLKSLSLLMNHIPAVVMVAVNASHHYRPGFLDMYAPVVAAGYKHRCGWRTHNRSHRKLCAHRKPFRFSCIYHKKNQQMRWQR